jgi:choline dehydrogenase-like flavoprotein
MNQNMNWGYKTSPQEHADNRECDYSRGKGLGGSSAINFGVYTIGARDDYEEWARLVGDEAFCWDKIQPRFKKLENFHGEIPAGIDSKYAAPRDEDHGRSGRLHVGYASEWERDLPPVLDLFDKAGFPLNQDHNSGNPLGMSVLINSSKNGLRSTANDLLTPKPENLTIITNAPVQRVLLDGTKAIGVESNGSKCKCTDFPLTICRFSLLREKGSRDGCWSIASKSILLTIPQSSPVRKSSFPPDHWTLQRS